MTNLLVLDIDDTLLKAADIHIYKKEGAVSIRLTPAQYAEDTDRITNPDIFDFSEFRNPEIVKNSILNGEPINRITRKVKWHASQNWEIAILTARGIEETIHEVMNLWMKENIDKRIKIKRSLTFAVNTAEVNYKGHTNADKKARVLKNLSDSYTNIKFIDDDVANLKAAKKLKLNNLKVVRA